LWVSENILIFVESLEKEEEYEDHDDKSLLFDSYILFQHYPLHMFI